MDILTGILIPFVGTTAGSACVFFLRGELKPGVQKAFLGFASGVMVAASVWSLLIPAMEMSEGLGKLAFLPAVCGFILGMAFLLFLDMVVPHLHMDTDQPEGAKSNWQKKAFIYGMLSGIVEPIGAGLMLLLAEKLEPFMPYFLSFAAGAMLYVVVEELVPEASEGEHSNIGTIGFAIGFVLMMVLDVALG